MRIKFDEGLFGLVILIVAVMFPIVVQGQDSTRSSVFREYRIRSPFQIIRPADVEYQLWEGFMLVHQANDGDPVAQQELGIRYLLGKGFEADTVRAAYWIDKAAHQNMSTAEYNLGVFLNNGWGLKWNPFEAFRWFKAAAARELPDAEFVLGLLYTDNLVVARDWLKAYRLVKEAADVGFEPARKAMKEFKDRGIAIPADSSTDSSYSPGSVSSKPSKPAIATSSMEPVYLDFGNDTATQVDDQTLLNEALRQGNGDLRKALGVSGVFESDSDSTGIELIRRAANAGSPEALTFLGRFFERGIGVPEDKMLAAEQYLRAARLDSRHATLLLLDLIREKGFLGEVESRSKRNDDDAAFVWAGLTELDLDQRIVVDQAFHLLVAAAGDGNIASLIELGRCYITGQWTQQNMELGRGCWERAASMGSQDASIRLAAAAVLSDTLANPQDGLRLASSGKADSVVVKAIKTLMSGAEDGSLIAQLTLGYCFEKGIGVAQDTPMAVGFYRNCAERGNRSAYESLKRLYDLIRPADKEFAVSATSP